MDAEFCGHALFVVNASRTRRLLRILLAPVDLGNRVEKQIMVRLPGKVPFAEAKIVVGFHKPVSCPHARM